MADPLVTLTQLADRLGRTLDSTEQIQADALILDASALVADIADPVELEASTLPGAIVPVIVSMVRRALDNPRGLSSESIGDYSYQTQQGGGSSGSIYATRREIRLIRKAVGRLGVGTVALEGYLPVDPRAVGADSLLGS